MTYAAIEAGGTKFRAALLDDALTILDEIRVATTTPKETLGAVTDFFAGRESIRSVGIASFGPLDLNPASSGFGSITSTPKPDWANTPLLTTVADALGVPADIQTDVEAAAVAEWSQGAAIGKRTVAYVTVGTGIGAAFAVGGVPHRGHGHSELGHIPVRRIEDDDFAGTCLFHGDCLEGMASGSAMAERWGVSGEALGGHPRAWEFEAGYLAQLVRVLTYAAAPDCVVFGGGVSQAPGLIDGIRRATHDSLAGYSTVELSMDDYVQPAALGQEAGLIGAGLLAARLVGESRSS